MKERPMIFNAEMVRAILDGRKTQTRRIMKPQPTPCTLQKGGHWWPSNVFKTMLHIEEEMQNGKGGWGGLVGDACPFGDVGDRMWVREAWARYNIDQDSHDMAYRATTPEDWPEEGRWRPSIHMPRWASRITLEITGVRVERLASVSDDDAGKEGYPADPAPYGGSMDKWLWFRQLWDSIYPDQSFKHNPWVWVIDFRRIEGGAA